MDKKEDYQNCSVLYCVRQLCTVIRTHVRGVLKADYWFRFPLDSFSFCRFVLALFAVVALKPNSITLSWSQTGTKLVADLQRAAIWLITSNELARASRSATGL